MDNPEVLSPEQQDLMSRAKRCEWAGVACLFALAALIYADAAGRIDSYLAQVIALTPPQRNLASAVFLASWMLAGVGLLLRSCELGLEFRARNAEQKAALGKVNRFRRVCLCGIVGAFVATVFAGGISGALGALLLLTGASCVLHHRLGAMSRQILS